MIYDQSLEQSFIAALIHRPNDYLQIESFFDEGDIFAEDGDIRHRSIFTIIKQAVKKNEEIDATIIAQRIKALGFSFEDDDLPIADYVKSLALRNSKEGSVFRLARELKKMSIRRQFEGTGRELIERMNEIPPSCSYSEIIEEADQIFNKQVNQFELDGDVPVNIFDEMEALIEERGNNPITDFGMMGPWEKVNQIYGSLVREGNITVLVARAKAGKTTSALAYTTYLADKYGVNVLHLDNGEMSKEELIFRQCAALSGVSMYLLETGKWRKAGPEIVSKVRSVWPRIKKLKFYYYCVGGMQPEEMIALTKRFYYNKVGRGNKMTISFDYLKTTGLLSNGISEWQLLGEIVDKFKKLIQKEILFDGNPMIGMFTSVQSNRSGIVTNKRKEDIVDDESIVGGSDRIVQFCSHLFIQRKKTMDEILEDGEQFGTHKLICCAARHLGEDVMGELEPVKIGDQLRKNFINLKINNFSVEECGDLRDIVRAKSVDTELNKGYSSEEEPDF